MRIFFVVIVFALSLQACAWYGSVVDKEKQVNQIPNITVKRYNFSDLKSWDGDSQKFAVKAFQKSCVRITKKDPNKNFAKLAIFGRYADWQLICQKIEDLNIENNIEAREFFENWFYPYLVYDADKDTNKGLFTGYYEPLLHGSLEKTDRYNIPLYKRPDDLIEVNLGNFRDKLSGIRIAGRVKSGRLIPYYDRGQIETGIINDRAEVLVWVDSQIQAFFLHIQGSGVVELPDGSYMRVGYAGQNGHIYYAIGRHLVDIGALTKEEVSLQTIKEWLEQNSPEAQEVMNKNRSYIFFKNLGNIENPLGAEGVELTPERSMAVDSRIIAYGVPIWLDAEGVIEKDNKIQKLLIAQDTGGAIKGAIRGDLFWGRGDKAEELAGKMKSKGRYWILLPKQIEIPKKFLQKDKNILQKIIFFLKD